MQYKDDPWLFPEYPSMEQPDSKKLKAKERWEKLKNKNFGLELCADAMFCGKYGIPLVKAFKDSIPERYIGIKDINPIGNSVTCVTCFESDYILEKLWDNPYNYVEPLSKYNSFCEPDFSLKVKSPLSVQIANTYRNHAIAFYMQENGIKVLPSMSWSSNQSYEFCFDGHEKGGAVIVSTIGVLKDERSLMYFHDGFREMLHRVSPDSVILYGDCNDKIMNWMPKQLDIHHFDHERFKRMRRNGK